MDHPQAGQGVGAKATKGIAFVAGAQTLKVALTFVSTVTVARLLSPQDYGVVAMSAPIAAFLLLFQDLGLGQAVIQSRSVSQQQLSSIFWVNVAASVGIAIVLVLAAPLVAWFYGDPRPGYVAAASACNIVVSGLALQHAALLNRELKFARLTAIDALNSICTFAATLSAAILLRNYWALWIGTFVGAVVNSAGLWASSRWKPSFSLNLSNSREMLKFGGSVTVFNILNYFARNADNVIVAKTSGPVQLGLYDRSYRLMMFPISNVTAPLGRVMLPVLARLNGDDHRYRSAFLGATWAITLVTGPAAAVAAATSAFLIPFLLGSRWQDASPIFFWLSIGSLYQPLSSATGWLFISTSRGRALARWGIFSSATTVASFAIGAPWGATGVAAAYVIVSLLRLPILYHWSSRGTPVKARDLYLVLIPPLAALAAAKLFVAASGANMTTLPLLVCTTLMAYATAIGASLLLADGRAFFAQARSRAANILTSPVVGHRKAGM
jgi:PST family polysaccharide transporter